MTAHPSSGEAVGDRSETFEEFLSVDVRDEDARCLVDDDNVSAMPERTRAFALVNVGW